MILLLLTLLLPSPGRAEDLSVQQALNEMIELNVDVRVQRTKAEAAESQLWAARGTFLPTLSLSAQQMNAGGNGYNPTIGTVFPTAQVYAASATWNLFRGGADVASLDAAFSERANERSLLDNACLQAEAKSAHALLDLIENKMAVDVYANAEAATRRYLKIAEERFDKSLLSREDMDKVGLDAANAEAKRADAETQYNIARGTVESLLGHADVKLQWPWEDRLNLASVKDLMTADAHSAMNDRPDHRAATAAFDTEDSRKRSLFRTMFTSIDLNYTQSRIDMPGQVSSGWSSLATVTIPIWNDYKDYSSYRTQVEAERAAEHRLKQVERDIESSVDSTQSNYRIAIQQYSSRIENLKRARHIFEQDEARFKIGRSDANDLNLDLNRVTQAEILALQGIEQAHLAYMNLLHAFGQRVSQ